MTQQKPKTNLGLTYILGKWIQEDEERQLKQIHDDETRKVNEILHTKEKDYYNKTGNNQNTESRTLKQI